MVEIRIKVQEDQFLIQNLINLKDKNEQNISDIILIINLKHYKKYLNKYYYLYNNLDRLKFIFLNIMHVIIINFI
jgi:hypothetical protein